MFVIRDAQLDALGAYMFERFEDRMVAHLRVAFPAYAAEAGEQRARELVRFGAQKAAGYGITSERNVALFVDLLVAAGAEFDTRADFAWSRPVLAHPRVPEDHKLDWLLDALPAKAPHVVLPASVRRPSGPTA